MTSKATEAEATLAQVLGSNPQKPEALNLYGLMLMESGQLEKDAACFRKALNNLGQALKSSGFMQEAAERFQQALALKPIFPDASANLRDIREVWTQRNTLALGFAQEGYLLAHIRDPATRKFLDLYSTASPSRHSAATSGCPRSRCDCWAPTLPAPENDGGERWLEARHLRAYRHAIATGNLGGWQQVEGEVWESGCTMGPGTACTLCAAEASSL